MPLVQITLLEGRTNQQKAGLANAITEAITEYLDVPNAHTTVIFKDIKASDSFQV
tara:strand:- start:294 stop:458 length:165 start_codon:yes stop_codon:yes gene_type:complete